MNEQTRLCSITNLSTMDQSQSRGRGRGSRKTRRGRGSHNGGDNNGSHSYTNIQSSRQDASPRLRGQYNPSARGRGAAPDRGRGRGRGRGQGRGRSRGRGGRGRGRGQRQGNAYSGSGNGAEDDEGSNSGDSDDSSDSVSGRDFRSLTPPSICDIHWRSMSCEDYTYLLPTIESVSVSEELAKDLAPGPSNPVLATELKITALEQDLNSLRTVTQLSRPADYAKWMSVAVSILQYYRRSLHHIREMAYKYSAEYYHQVTRNISDRHTELDMKLAEFRKLYMASTSGASVDPKEPSLPNPCIQAAPQHAGPTTASDSMAPITATMPSDTVAASPTSPLPIAFVPLVKSTRMVVQDPTTAAPLPMTAAPATPPANSTHLSVQEAAVTTSLLAANAATTTPASSIPSVMQKTTMPGLINPAKRKLDHLEPQPTRVESRVQGSSLRPTPGTNRVETQRSKTVLVKGSPTSTSLSLLQHASPAVKTPTVVSTSLTALTDTEALDGAAGMIPSSTALSNRGITSSADIIAPTLAPVLVPYFAITTMPFRSASAASSTIFAPSDKTTAFPASAIDSLGTSTVLEASASAPAAISTTAVVAQKPAASAAPISTSDSAPAPFQRLAYSGTVLSAQNPASSQALGPKLSPPLPLVQPSALFQSSPILSSAAAEITPDASVLMTSTISTIVKNTGVFSSLSPAPIPTKSAVTSLTSLALQNNSSRQTTVAEEVNAHSLKWMMFLDNEVQKQHSVVEPGSGQLDQLIKELKEQVEEQKEQVEEQKAQVEELKEQIVDLKAKDEKHTETYHRMVCMYDLLNKAFRVHTTLSNEILERNEIYHRKSTEQWNREVALLREQVQGQQLKIETLLETKLEKVAEAESRNELRLEKMQTMLEAKLRKDANEDVVQLHNEIFIKDQEIGRANAQREISEAHTQAAQAREERAEARELAARTEIHNISLLRTIQEMQTKGYQEYDSF